MKKLFYQLLIISSVIFVFSGCSKDSYYEENNTPATNSSRGAVTSLAGTSWCFDDANYKYSSSGGYTAYTVTYLFSFRKDGTFIYSVKYLGDSSLTTYSSTYSESKDGIVLNWEDGQVYHAEIIDNVLYIYNDRGYLKYRLIKL